MKGQDTMKPKFNIKSMLLGGFLGALIMFSVGAAAVGRTTWDYKIISGRLGKVGQPGHAPLGQQLDQAAADGWEVVSTASDDGYPFVILQRAK
jgi:hypothetical protein